MGNVIDRIRNAIRDLVDDYPLYSMFIVFTFGLAFGILV